MTANKVQLFQVDAFTDQKFTGNPAGVVLNADGLTEDQMQQVANEMNVSETAFIFSPTDDSHDVHVRFFTPTREVPICGHATIASHFVRARSLNLDTCTVTQKTGVGNLPVEITKTENSYTITLTLGKAEVGESFPGEHIEELLNALSLSPNDLDPRCPIEFASVGNKKIIIGVKNKEILNKLNPDFKAMIKLNNKIGKIGFFVFTLDSDDPEILANGRNFNPVLGIDEDPVTGVAQGPLGAYLVHHNLVPHDGKLLEFKSKQGEAMGRPGIAHVTVDIENNQPTIVKVGGNAIIVFESELKI